MNRETLTLWLVLLARSCRQIADTLTAQHQNSKPIIISLTSSLRARRFSSGLLSPQGLLQRCIEALGAMHKILLLLEYLPGYKAGTAAAGQHEHQQLLQSIDSLRQTLQLDLTEQADGWPPDSQQYDAEWDQFTSTIKPDSLVQLTQIVDQVVTLSPTRHCCNNPSCSSTASLSELKLAHSKGTVCAGCKSARYCGRACQVAHWRAVGGHKAVCRRIQAVTLSADSADGDH